jgi:hypothetical protein
LARQASERRHEIKTDDNNVQVIEENDAALPLFQRYSRYQAVASRQEAINAGTNPQTRPLIIEDPDRRLAPPSSPMPESATNDQRLDVIQATDTEYRLSISSAKPPWFFLAIANYPGWTASPEGEDVPIFSAQVLGKAVAIPSGNHEVVFRFRPKTFFFGLLISIAAFATLALTTAVQAYRKRTRPQIAGERAR